MSWKRQAIAASVALTATLVGFSGVVVDERVAATLLAFGLLFALGLGGRPAPPLRGSR
jgi:hypothetical protein